MKAEVRDAAAGLQSVDAVVASSWETAHVVASRCDWPVHRFYFIQDYEPFFYPRGSMYELAKDSYRFGFQNIALGGMVAGMLRDELQLEPEVTQFGCDTSVYSYDNSGPREGVVFYAKPTSDRRGYLLGKLALAEFHRRHPEQPIHVYGGGAERVAFPVIDHGRLSPAELNVLYNQTLGGLAMSFTNISLVAEEMLAAGTIPVVNDADFARADLAAGHVEWALPTPGGIADALSRIVQHRSPSDRASRAAGSVRQGWGPAESAVSDAILGALRGQKPTVSVTVKDGQTW
jgi:hypothetical protein